VHACSASTDIWRASCPPGPLSGLGQGAGEYPVWFWGSTSPGPRRGPCVTVDAGPSLSLRGRKRHRSGAPSPARCLSASSRQGLSDRDLDTPRASEFDRQWGERRDVEVSDASPCLTATRPRAVDQRVGGRHVCRSSRRAVPGWEGQSRQAANRTSDAIRPHGLRRAPAAASSRSLCSRRGA